MVINPDNYFGISGDKVHELAIRNEVRKCFSWFYVFHCTKKPGDEPGHEII